MREMYRYSTETVARACYAVLDIMNDAQGPPWSDVPFEPFDALPEQERDDLWFGGVVAARSGATPRELFGMWAAVRRALGWKWGPVKDAARKTHPNLVDNYDHLPAPQRDKDKAFLAVVTAMTDVTPVLPRPEGPGDGKDTYAVQARLRQRSALRHPRRDAWLRVGAERRGRADKEVRRHLRHVGRRALAGTA